MLGVITNVLAYLPVFFLIELFRRTSSRTSKIKRLQKSISTISTAKKVNLLPMKGSKKNIQFPWWLKIILYLASFACMAFSIFSVFSNFHMVSQVFLDFVNCLLLFFRYDFSHFFNNSFSCIQFTNATLG